MSETRANAPDPRPVTLTLKDKDGEFAFYRVVDARSGRILGSGFTAEEARAAAERELRRAKGEE